MTEVGVQVQKTPVRARPAVPAAAGHAGRSATGGGGVRPLLAVPAAVAAGLGLLLSFPPYDVWWLAPVAVAVLAVVAHRQRLTVALGLGWLAGLALFVPVLAWTNLHTGYLPWLLLSVAQAGYLGLLAVAAAFAGPLVDRRRWLWPPLTGLLWVAQEALRDRTPFGGFPWARLAFSQGDAPLLRWAAVGGAPLVTFGVALAGGLLAAAVWRLAGLVRAGRVRTGRGRVDAGGAGGGVFGWWVALCGVGGAGLRRSGLAAVVGLLAGVAVVPVVGLAVPTARPAGRPVTVAVVQGNVPRMGLDFNAQRRAVLDNHVRQTVALAGRVRAGEVARPDLVVWPENSSDIDPLRNADAAGEIDRAARAVGVPILVGAVLRGPGPGQVRNAGMLWLPGGPDLDQLYVKRHPVPFAEYVPLRRIARMVSTEVDRVRSEFVPGTRPGVVRAGPLVLGDVICFEVAYDEVVRDTVTGGAQVLVVQTNNATFDEAEARQQLAMVRLRAVEHGRESLMASTVGVSGFVTTDGTVIDATGFNTEAVVVREMRLGSTRTLATTLGLWPEAVLVVLAVAVLAGAVPARRRTRVRSEAVRSEAEKGGQQR